MSKVPNEINDIINQFVEGVNKILGDRGKNNTLWLLCSRRL